MIVCEGSKTEPRYFEGFRLTNVKVVGTGYNTDSLVQYAIQLKRDAQKEKEPFNQVWCVFDRDSFPVANFNNALTLARQHSINTAYSNEAFELWYLLHFHYYESAISRDDYITKLDGLLGFKYQKNCQTMFDELVEKQDIAIRNAERLLSQYPDIDPVNNNPSTTIHVLVKELNKWVR
ncbi:MAG: RloB family protein [Clostridia bacterium]|nr:RloB family protein [Clostridia bacterium]